MEETFTLKITGSGTKDEITKALQDLIVSLIDLEDSATFEDATLCTEISKD